MEEWRLIVGSDGYCISNLGRIKSLEKQVFNSKNNCYGTKKEKILKYCTNNTKGYCRLHILYKNGKRINESVHRLVAKTFIDNPNNLPQVNHIDGNKENNNVSNLEWCTNQYNQIHAINTGLKQSFHNSISGERSHLNKYSEDTIRKIPNLIEQGLSYFKIGKILGIPTSLISEIKKGRAWKHLNLIIPDSKIYKKDIVQSSEKFESITKTML